MADDKPRRRSNPVTGANAMLYAQRWKVEHPRAYWLLADAALKMAARGQRLSITAVSEVVRATYIPHERNEVPFKLNNTLRAALAGCSRPTTRKSLAAGSRSARAYRTESLGTGERMNRETFSEACLQALNEELEVFAPIRCTVNLHSRFIGSMLGTYGIEPELDYPLDVFFDEAKEDIDKSIAYRERGKKGGRPKKAPEVKTFSETGFNQSEKCLKAPAEKVSSLNGKGIASIQDKTLQVITRQDIHINKEEEESFPFQCLKAFNEELRSSLERCKPADCWRTARPKRSGGKP